MSRDSNEYGVSRQKIKPGRLIVVEAPAGAEVSGRPVVSGSYLAMSVFKSRVPAYWVGGRLVSTEVWCSHATLLPNGSEMIVVPLAWIRDVRTLRKEDIQRPTPAQVQGCSLHPLDSDFVQFFTAQIWLWYDELAEDGWKPTTPKIEPRIRRIVLPKDRPMTDLQDDREVVILRVPPQLLSHLREFVAALDNTEELPAYPLSDCDMKRHLPADAKSMQPADLVCSGTLRLLDYHGEIHHVRLMAAPASPSEDSSVTTVIDGVRVYLTGASTHP